MSLARLVGEADLRGSGGESPAERSVSPRSAASSPEGQGQDRIRG